jgi:hypothetical protein
VARRRKKNMNCVNGKWSRIRKGQWIGDKEKAERRE